MCLTPKVPKSVFQLKSPSLIQENCPKVLSEIYSLDSEFCNTKFPFGKCLITQVYC